MACVHWNLPQPRGHFCRGTIVWIPQPSPWHSGVWTPPPGPFSTALTHLKSFANSDSSVKR